MKERNRKNWMTGRSMGGNEGYVVAGILIVVAIAVGVIFKDQISAYLTNFFTSLTSLSNTSFF